MRCVDQAPTAASEGHTAGMASADISSANPCSKSGRDVLCHQAVPAADQPAGLDPSDAATQTAEGYCAALTSTQLPQQVHTK